MCGPRVVMTLSTGVYWGGPEEIWYFECQFFPGRTHTYIHVNLLTYLVHTGMAICIPN